MSWRARLRGLFGARLQRDEPLPPVRGYRKLVVILDGTLSSMEPGCETNAGLAAKLLREKGGEDVAVYYEAGLQWQDWRDTLSVMTGDGINGQIRRAYGWLASKYRRGDRIYFIGYSRGAYAARSLAGIIGRIGLLRRGEATERNLRDVYRLYCAPERVEAAQAFAAAHCHDGVQIESVAVWDTVKALGIRLPLVWMLTNRMHRFHDHTLGAHVRSGYHALALNETRRAYAPVLWETTRGWRGELEQVWFLGTHAEVGGQLGGRHWARGRSNIPFVWLMGRLDHAGLRLPEAWERDYPQDAGARGIGAWAGWQKFFWNRWPRRVGRDPSERVHETALREAKLPTQSELTLKAPGR